MAGSAHLLFLHANGGGGGAGGKGAPLSVCLITPPQSRVLRMCGQAHSSHKS